MLSKLRQKLAHYPRLRIVLFVLLFVVIFVVTIRMFSASYSTVPNLPKSRIHSISSAPGIASTVNKKNAAEYKQLSKEKRKTEVRQASKSGKSFFSNAFDEGGIVATKHDDAPLSPETFYKNKVAKPKKPKKKHTDINPLSQVAMQAQAEQRNNNGVNGNNANNVQNTLDNRISALSSKMDSAISDVSDEWKLPNFSTIRGSLPMHAASTGVQYTKSQVIIKAGTVLFAVLNTAINSDQKTPILATVITGKYKGTLLIGSFAREREKVVVKFNRMSLTTKDRTLGINAYAIDGDTADAALASDVDHHYLLKYGGLFAAGFLQGFGNAFANYRCVGAAECYVLGGQNGGAPRITTKEAVYRGLGQVGKNLSEVFREEARRPVTVTVKQGIGIGILFMSDVVV